MNLAYYCKVFSFIARFILTEIPQSGDLKMNTVCKKQGLEHLEVFDLKAVQKPLVTSFERFKHVGGDLL